MSRLRTWFAPPRNGDVRETLRWVRRVEIGIGALGLIAVGGGLGAWMFSKTQP